MQKSTLRIIGNKAVLNNRERMCETPEELIGSEMFRIVLDHCLENLRSKKSPLMDIFPEGISDVQAVDDLVKTLVHLVRYESNVVPHIFDKSAGFLRDSQLLNNFVEFLYDYWRHFDRFIINDSEGDRLDKRPYRTFNETIEHLTHLIRTVYRHIQENITGSHPNVYRQVPAGAKMAVISLPKEVGYSAEKYRKLNCVQIIRQMLIYPPLVIQQPMNKRTGQFKKIQQNPIDLISICSDEWICYPAKVGKLLIMVYFHISFFELGFSLCNLFQLADDSDLEKSPDALCIYGAPGNILDGLIEISNRIPRRQGKPDLCGCHSRQARVRIFRVPEENEIDGDHPVIERFDTPEQALNIFRSGAVMSKGTTTSSGLVHSYFANIFGPPEYKDLHEKIADKYFRAFYRKNIFVGQMRTRLGIPGYEASGPKEAATELLKIIGVYYFSGTASLIIS